MFGRIKNKCNRGGLLLNSEINILRANNKNELVRILEKKGLFESAKLLHEIQRNTNNHSFVVIESGILSAFTWSETNQDRSYWSGIYRRINKYSDL